MEYWGIISFGLTVLFGIIGTLLMFIFRNYTQQVKSLAGDIKTLQGKLENNDDKHEKDCNRRREDIYSRFLTKELFESQKEPIVSAINKLENQFEEMAKRLYSSISELQRSQAKLELSIQTLLQIKDR